MSGNGATSSSSSSKDKKMLIKFENKSNRVKGLAFHSKRPWILASLHNGVIQLWDYRMETLIDKFEEHDGPVRGIHFHLSQPLFVSGGDDYKIKVWNYQTKRCLFNLLGHLDYIRTVQFHHEYPWILSASDDQTIRIWNWQSRQCLSVLTGHNHYVMCAQFHPKEDLVLSASLDQTVRVWDVSGLRKKTVSIASDFSTSLPGNDLFGGSDVIVKHVLEGHTRGVNWASFHRTLSLIVSGADDREVKLWRMNDSKAWEVDTMRGHINNVSCVLFHPKRELIISNSEDKTIRVWDISKQANPVTLRRENDRYWILDAHPTLNLLAAGHDSGLVVFKLSRERPPYDSHKNMYYFKDLYVYEYSFKTQKEKPILSTRRRGNNTPVSYRSLAYNESNSKEHNLLLCSDADGSYELYTFPKGEMTGRDDSSQALRGFGKCAVFVSRNRFAVLDKSRQLWLKNLKNETKRKITIPNLFINHIFPGGVGRLLLRTTDAMVLYDIQALKIVAELPTQSRHPIKYISWSHDNKHLAMWSKANIYITDSKLEEICTVNENSRVKSGGWDEQGVFVYTTATHIKYLLPNGESGIIRTLDFPIYLTQVTSTTVSYIDRELKPGSLTIDATEYQFKMALMKHKNREVLRIMQSKKLVGQSIIAYLQKKGYPEVALHFVQDETIKFTLALECGNIAVALECATKLDNDECWHKLGVEALRQGNHQVVEAAYQKTKNFERLSFLYLITGNLEKLSKMLHIATLRQDLMGRYHNALYLGNIQERIAVLREAGQLGLALLTAITHGLEEEAAALREEMGDKVPNLPDVSKGKLLLPPTPILKETNWPLLQVRLGFFDQAEREDEVTAAETTEARYDSSGDEHDEDKNDADVLDWDMPGEKKEKKKPAAAAADVDVGAAGGWGGDDLDIPIGDEEVVDEKTTGDASDDYFVMPLSGKSAHQKWSNSSALAPDMIAAGSFDLAMHLLNKQIGIVNFAPLKDSFLAIYTSAQAQLPFLPNDPSIPTPLARPSDAKDRDVDLPDIVFKLSQTHDLVKSAYKAVTEGSFAAAAKIFQTIIHMLPLMVVEKKSHVQDVHELVAICREYITAIRLETARKETQDPVKQAALAAYFTQCKLQPMHLVLGLRVALKCAYTIKNFNMTAGFCRRILELSVSSNIANINTIVDAKKIRGVLQVCEKSATDEHSIEYPESAFTLCAKSLTPIAKGKPTSRCPYCSSAFHGEHDDTLCPTCQLAKIGADGTGLKVYAENL